MERAGSKLLLHFHRSRVSRIRFGLISTDRRYLTLTQLYNNPNFHPKCHANPNPIGTIVTSFFLNVALITLANEAVGCEKDQDGAFDDCDKLLGGMFSPNNINIVISFGNF